MVILGFALYIGLNKGLKKQREQWSSYELLLGVDVVTRKQLGTPEVTIQKNEVTGVQEVQGNHLIVKTADKRKFIVVSRYLEGYEEVKTHLAEWQALEILPQRSVFKQPGIWLGLALVAGFIIVWVSQSIQIILPLGILLIAFFVWAVIELQRSSQVDARLKRNSWVGLLVAILIIGVKIWAFLPR